MMKTFLFATAMFLLSVLTAGAQTLDTAALAGYNASTVREVYEVCRYVKLDAAQQQQLARSFEREDSVMVAMIGASGGVLTVKDSRKLEKMHDGILASVLSEDQLGQYYRGVFDKVSLAEAEAVVARLQKKYKLTDQNGKFIRVAFYKIGLDSRVISKLMADQPAKAKKKIEQLRKEQLATIEAKGGIRVNPEGTTVTFVKPFDPNALHRE